MDELLWALDNLDVESAQDRSARPEASPPCSPA